MGSSREYLGYARERARWAKDNNRAPVEADGEFRPRRPITVVLNGVTQNYSIRPPGVGERGQPPRTDAFRTIRFGVPKKACNKSRKSCRATPQGQRAQASVVRRSIPAKSAGYSHMPKGLGRIWTSKALLLGVACLNQ